MRMHEEMERKRLETEEELAHREEERRKQALIGKAILDDQLEERERARARAYEEFIRDKQQIDDIVRKIEEEDER